MKTTAAIITAALTLCGGATLFFHPAQAEETITDKDIAAKAQKLRDEAALLTAETEKITAESNLLNAKYPGIPGGKDGAISTAASSYYPFAAKSESFNAVVRAADRICEIAKSAGAKDEVIVIPMSYNLPDMALRYRIAKKELDYLKAELERANSATNTCATATGKPETPAKQQKPAPGMGALPSAEVGGTVAAAAFVKSAVDISKIFRVDRTIHTETPTMTDDDLVSAVHICLKGRSLKDRVLQSLVSNDSQKSSFLEALDAAQATREELRSRAQGKSCSGSIESSQSRFDSFYSQLMSVADGKTESKMGVLLSAEILVRASTPSGTSGRPLLLSVGINETGGATQLAKSTFFSDRLYASGGVIVKYSLQNHEGLSSEGLIVERTDFTRIPLK